jgi:hypothetical protein
MNPDALAWALAQPAGTHAAVLASAYLGGVTRVTFEGRTVEYRSSAELAKVLAALWGASLSFARRPSMTTARISNGFGE